MSLLSPNRCAHVRNLFESALELPRASRTAFLFHQCPNDHETREEVLALLAADDTAVDVPAENFLAAAAAEEVPETRFPEIAGFAIEAQLGSGGSSRVYRAVCLENGATVALKVIHSGANRQGMQRFRQECRVLAKLNHPRIVGLHETGHTSDGNVYLAMDFVHGVCIDRWVKERNPSASERVQLILQVLDALAHAHEFGVTHRDIKPHNILVDEHGQIRLLDFGVARLAREDGNRTGFHTETGNIVGTFAYMSPEQADGKSSRIGPATDVYQSALVLFELLTGRLPYEVEDRGAMALLKAVLFERRLTLSEVCPALSGPLEVAIDGALHADPSMRPQTVVEFAEQLRLALAFVSGDSAQV